MLDVDRLYREHWPAIHGFLRARMPGAPGEEVEDLTADVFVRVCLARARAYREEGKELSWLFKIAHRLMIDRRRRLAGRAPEAELDEDGPADPSHSDAGSWSQADALDIEAAMRRLPPRWQQVLVERYYLDAPDADTALLLGCSADNVRRLRRAALRRLGLLLRRGARVRPTRSDAR